MARGRPSGCSAAGLRVYSWGVHADSRDAKQRCGDSSSRSESARGRDRTTGPSKFPVDKARQVQAIEIMHVARAQEPVLRRHQAHHGNAPSPPQLPSITSCRKYATAAGSWHVEGILPRPLGGGSTPDEAPRRAGASAACAGFRRGAHRIAEVVRLTGPPRSRRLGPPARSRVASAPASA